MQNQNETPATIIPAHAANAPSVKPEHSAAQPIVSAETVAAITTAETTKRDATKAAQAAKRASVTPEAADSRNTRSAAKRVAKRTAAKANANTAKPAKPSQAAREQAQRDQADARRLARDVAAKAVSAFYTGASKPFKAASDRFADLNPANAKAATPRQAALALALITYGAGNMRSDGTFKRGGFIVPARLLNPNAKPGDTVRAQPESGCLGNMLKRSVDYRSGPRSGRDQIEAIFQLRVPVALAEIQAAFGDKQAAAAKRLLASFAKAA